MEIEQVGGKLNEKSRLYTHFHERPESGQAI